MRKGGVSRVLLGVLTCGAAAVVLVFLGLGGRARFGGSLERGETHRRSFGPGFTLVLAPIEHGWSISILDRRGVDLSRLTRGVLRIVDFALDPPAAGRQASFEHLRYEVELNWPSRASWGCAGGGF